jgi:MFS family permease
VSATPSARGWLIWGLAASFFAVEFLFRMSPGVMVTDLMRDFAVGAGALGALAAFYIYAYAGMQIPVGVILDRFGPRRLLTVSAGCCALGCLLFAWAPSLRVAEAGRLIGGLGGGASFLTALALAAAWLPPNRFALVTGLTMLSGIAGAITAQGPLAIAVEHFGWRDSILGVGLLFALLVLPIWFLAREPHGHRSSRIRLSIWRGLRVVASRRHVWLAALAGCCFAGPMLAFGGLWGVPFLMQTHGLAREPAAGLNSLILLGWGLGGPLVGWLTDRIRLHKPPLISAILVAMFGWLLLALLPGLPLPIIAPLYLLIGMASGGMLICYSMTRIYAPPEFGGTAGGLINTIMIGMGAVLQPVTGWLLDLQWTGTVEQGVRVYPASAFEHAILIYPALQALGLLAALLLPETYHRLRGPR